MPRYNVDRATSFIVEDESWIVIEYDYTSVPGVIYLSLTENKVNIIYDDLDNNIADTDRLAKYTFAVPENPQEFAVGDEIIPTCTLMKDGLVSSLHVDFYSTDTTRVDIVNGRLTAIGEGETKILAQLTDYPEIQQEIDINITNATSLAAYIEGPDVIRLDRKADFRLQSNQELDGEVTYAVDNDLVSIITVEDNVCSVRANNKNKLGSVILTATYGGNEYVKVISIIPIW